MIYLNEERCFRKNGATEWIKLRKKRKTTVEFYRIISASSATLFNTYKLRAVKALQPWRTVRGYPYNHSNNYQFQLIKHILNPRSMTEFPSAYIYRLLQRVLFVLTRKLPSTTCQKPGSFPLNAERSFSKIKRWHSVWLRARMIRILRSRFLSLQVPDQRFLRKMIIR